MYRWGIAAVVTSTIAYFATGFMNVCEVNVVWSKFLFSPFVALVAAGGASLVASARDSARVLGVVLISALVGQVMGYTWPWICF